MGKTKPPKGKGKKPSKGANGKPDSVLVSASALGMEILTLEEAASLLRISADALKADAESGTVPGRFVGGEWRFLKHSLHSWFTYPQPIRVHASDVRPPVGMERITKSVPQAPTTPNASQLSSLGSMADDDSLPAMVEEIYRRRTEE